MSLFVIGDLHLPFGAQKPMDIFYGWQNYTEILKKNWLGNISENDTVVLPGDFSWGINLEETRADFEFLQELPGKKVMLRGNHDYWWVTLKKNIDFATENGFDVSFIQNNFYAYNKVALCGSRGWFLENTDNYSQKVAAREEIRLELSLKAAEEAGYNEKLVFLHFPPIYKDKLCVGLIDIMEKYNVKQCFYGHLHGSSISGAFNGVRDGIEYKLVSSDYLKFMPLKISY